VKLERYPAVLAEDLPGIYASIARDDPAAADRVLDAIDLTFKQLRQHPESGIAFRGTGHPLADIRMLPVRGFRNYLVFYRVDGDRLRILHVLHGAQHIGRVMRREARK
jgi:toxin ParE1/3/4